MTRKDLKNLKQIEPHCLIKGHQYIVDLHVQSHSITGLVQKFDRITTCVVDRVVKLKQSGKNNVYCNVSITIHPENYIGKFYYPATGPTFYMLPDLEEIVHNGGHR